MKKGFWIVVVLLVASVSINVWFWTTEPEPSIVIKRDTVYNDTTIYKPVPVDSHKTGRIVYIRIPYPVPKYLPGDTVHDSIEVPIPIMQKRYEDSLYTAWVSGYEPNIDSINLRLPTITETVTKTIVKPSPLITVGIQAGAGYGVINRKPDIYVGVGAQVNLWRTKR